MGPASGTIDGPRGNTASERIHRRRQAGYNLEGSGGVFGIEVDARWLRLRNRSLTGIPLVASDAMTNTTQATFLSTFRLRWGPTAYPTAACCS